MIDRYWLCDCSTCTRLLCLKRAAWLAVSLGVGALLGAAVARWPS